MTKHDDVRQILYESGFKFKDGKRTALDMTDEEVEKFLVEFTSRLTRLGVEMTKVMEGLAQSVVRALKPLQDLNRMLAESETDDPDVQGG